MTTGGRGAGKRAPGDAAVLGAVRDFPLGSAQDLAEALGASASTTGRRLTRLQENGLVDSARLGACFPPAQRYRLTPEGAADFAEPDRYFHTARNVNSLTAFLPAVEWFYRLAARLPAQAAAGRLQSFHWRLREGVDAVARCAAGTVGFIWSGPWQSFDGLEARLEAVGRGDGLSGGWPALLCVVAVDYWQACQAADAVAGFGLSEGCLVFCAETKSARGSLRFRDDGADLALTPLLAQGGAQPPAAPPRLLQSWRSGTQAAFKHRLLLLVEQFPGARAAGLERALGAHRRQVTAALQQLLEQEALVQADGHYYLTDATLGMAARRDRVHVNRPRRRFGLRDDGLPAVARYRKHDGAVFSIASAFRRAGFPVAGGWRGDDYSGGESAIAPDALVYAGPDSTGGAGWRYFEYERRANAAGKVADKLRGYLARATGRDALPVLIAARSEGVAAEFRRQAARHGYPLWAASIGAVSGRTADTVWGMQPAWKDARGQSAQLWPPPGRA